MRYTPSTEEYSALTQMSLEDRFLFATTRMNESEEVWSLGDENGWLIQDRGDRQIITIWPYRDMAIESAIEKFEGNSPISVSLEHFLYGLLKQCQESDITIEVNPAPGKEGYTVPAGRLYEVLENMMEAGSYFVEG